MNLREVFKVGKPEYRFTHKPGSQQVNLYQGLAKLELDMAMGFLSEEELKSVQAAVKLVTDGKVADEVFEHNELAYLLLKGLKRL